MTELNIQFTAQAIAHVKKMLENKGAEALRLSIKKTGCSGFAYAPTLVSEIKETDFQFQHHGITIYIDPLWAHVMQGLQVDCVEENQNGLKQKKLIFTNPNETARCGCGESFHLE